MSIFSQKTHEIRDIESPFEGGGGEKFFKLYGDI